MLPIAPFGSSPGRVWTAPNPPPSSAPPSNPHRPAAPPGPNPPQLPALALFGRRPPQRVEGVVMPASKNLHITGNRPCSLDQLVGAGDERCRHLDAERFRGLQIDDQLELRWQIVGYIARAGASQDLCN